MTLLISLLVALVVGLLGLLARSLGGMHSKWSPVVDAVRGANMRFFNPMQMQTAGTPDAFAGILRHVGRISGTPSAASGRRSEARTQRRVEP